MKHIELEISVKPVLLIGILIFVVAFAARLFYVETTEFIDPIRADAKKYFLLAINLAHEGSYSMELEEPYRPTTAVTPGYPLFLLAFIGLQDNLETSFHSILLTQSFLGALSTLLLYIISLRVLPFKWAAMFGFILTLVPHHVVFSGYVLTETWFTFLFTSSIYSLIKHLESGKSLWLVQAGLLCGMATLTRPAALLLMPFIASTLVFIRAIKLPNAAALFLTATLPWIPWQVWVQQTTDNNLAKQNQFASVLAFGSYPDFIFKSNSMRGYPYREDPEYPAMSRSTSYAITTILARAKAEPMRYLYWYTLGKPINYWSWNMMESVGGPFIYPVGSNIWTRSSVGQFGLTVYHGLHRLLILIGTPIFFLLCYSIMRRAPNQNASNNILYLSTLIIFYFTIIHLILAAWPRYAVPFWPFFYLLGMKGLCQLTILFRHLKSTLGEENDNS